MTIVKFINEVGFKVREGDVKKVNGTISDIKSTATKLLGAIAALETKLRFRRKSWSLLGKREAAMRKLQE